MLGKSSIFEQAEGLLYFSYASNEKCLLVVLQGLDYILYDPKIATIEILIEALRQKNSFILAILEKKRLIIFLQHTNAIYFLLS